MSQMNIQWVDPGKLIPYEMNAKQHPPKQVEHIANSIKAFGWKQPIVVDADNVVIIGHGRLLAAKHLMLDTVPVVYADDLTEEQANALRLADNKTNESEWDFSKLEEELAQLAIDGIDMSDFGFDVGGGIPENLDAEPETDQHIYVKLTFPDFNSYAPHEDEIKTLAEKVGAEFGLVRG